MTESKKNALGVLNKVLESILKIEKALEINDFQGFYSWVPAGTRTLDIQNHNLTL